MKYIKETVKLSAALLTESLAKDAKSVIADAENHYKSQIDEICANLMNKKQTIVFLTGPSASGKTTTAEIILERLENQGIIGARVSLDNFYKNTDQLPRFSDGRKNFETIEALDLECFKNCLTELENKGRAVFPTFDFNTGKRCGKTFVIDKKVHNFLIFEGIHALNPLICKSVEIKNAMRLYISVHSIFVDENGDTLLKAKHLRLIRRILRDITERNAPPLMTLEMWKDVCDGEAKYIRRYSNLADFHINSTHFYEPALFKKVLLKALTEYEIPDKYSDLTDTLKNAMEYFPELDSGLLPGDSLLREFYHY